MQTVKLLVYANVIYKEIDPLQLHIHRRVFSGNDEW